MIPAFGRAALLALSPMLMASCSWLDDDVEVAESFEREIYVDGLELPVAMALDPAGRLLVTEKSSGEVRLVNEDGELQEEPVMHFDVASEGEWGLLGIALHPEYEANQLVYVYYMEPEDNGRAHPVIVRFELDGERGRSAETVVDDLPLTPLAGGSPEVDLFSNIHVGGTLHFGPDGLLYVAIGDFGVFDKDSADPSKLTGKILRFTDEGQPAPAGGLPSDADSRVFAYGLRNPFDFDFGEDGSIFAVDNGPEYCDEINIVREGQNYGWPSARVSADSCERREGQQAIAYLSKEGYEPHEQDSPVGPSGILYLADGFGRLEGPGLVVCEVNTQRLRYLPLDGESVEMSEAVDLADDCFTDVIQASDGSLLYTTADAIHTVVPEG